MIFWNMNPERTKTGMSSKATGDRELLTGLITTLKSITPAFARIIAPINLKEEIENSAIDDPAKLAIALRYKLFEKYYDEKRAVLGPVIKSRNEMMEKVLYQKEVLERIEKLAIREKVSVKKMKKRAYLIFREIAADYSISYIMFFSIILRLIFNRMFNGISYDPDSIKKVKEASVKGPLILVPCHKSHMDYLILSHLFYINRLIPPHIAAGVNLSFFPFGTLFRHSGAFFIRRSFLGQKLYMVIFRQYIRTLIEEGYSIEFFMEGGRTRTGKLIQPQLGFLHFLIEAINSGYNDDLVFVPISINYDRILEEKAHMKEIKGNEKEAESIKSVVKGRKLLKKTYGKVYISFGEIFTLKEISSDAVKSRELPAEIANRIFNRINEVTVVTSFALASCAILLLSERGFSGDALRLIIDRLYNYLVFIKARMSDTLRERANIDEIIKHVLHTYLHDRILEQLKIVDKKKEVHIDDFYVLKDDNRTRIGFYKNNIIHYFVPAAFVSCAILRSTRDGKAAQADVRAGYFFLKDLFSREFVYPANDEIIDGVLEYLKTESVITRGENGEIIVAESRRNDLLIYSKMILDQIESYYVVIRTIIDSNEARLKRNKLLINVRKTGYKMYHLGGLDLAESLSVPSFVNAIDRFSSMGILKGGDRLRDDAEVDICGQEKARGFEKNLEDFLSVFRK
jgi:glycerol-3-phosphate O-acyltransferase